MRHRLAPAAALAAVLGPLALDSAFPSRWTAPIAFLGMSAGLALAFADARVHRGSRSLLLRRARIEVIAWLLLAAMAMLGIARVWIFVAQLGSRGEPFAEGTRVYDALFVALFAAGKFLRWQGLATARLSIALAARPALVLAGSFLLLILAGTLLLLLPFSLHSIDHVDPLDALFTMTSAVCVTGLTVNDVGTTYSLAGEAILLAGIQLGGIGFMTLAAFAFATGGLRTETRYAAMVGASSLAALRPTIRGVVTFTLACEAVGALILFALWSGDPRLEGRSAAWAAVFHSISAFCNAGFSLFAGNLVPFAQDTLLLTAVMVLVVLGGLGFPVLRELAGLAGRLARRLFRRTPGPALRLQHASRVALVATAALVVIGAGTFALLEAGGVLADMPAWDRLVSALFASVTARTAGFNTVDSGALRPATMLLVMVLMFIGGSPASTAGGVKTTTIAVMLAVLRAELSGGEPRLGARAIPPEVRRRATAVVVLSLGIVLASLALLTLTDPRLPFLSLAFESVSAFGTTGLSTGITASLSGPGKLVLIVTMFIGRVGPLTIALAVASRERAARIRLAAEPVPVG